MTILQTRYEHLLQVTPIEFWFTMPAIWSDRAQEATRQAARAAGFGTREGDLIQMITEPEAGVHAALTTESNVTNELLEVSCLIAHAHTLMVFHTN
jgi:molecular chaperone DnaK (HSP70)